MGAGLGHWRETEASKLSWAECKWASEVGVPSGIGGRDWDEGWGTGEERPLRPPGEQLDIGIAFNQHKAAPVSKQRGQ